MRFLWCLSVCFLTMSCGHDGFMDLVSPDDEAKNVLFLHHSTGYLIYEGGAAKGKSAVVNWFDTYNRWAKTPVHFVAQVFPKSKRLKYFGYGWKNYPYDYHQIWVENAEKGSYKGEPTLKTLTPHWDVVILKHCFPVSSVCCDLPNEGGGEEKRLMSYQTQYLELRNQMQKYPQTQFVVWTGAALTRESTNERSALCARIFFDWVKQSWDLPDDNIFIWDFYELETEGSLYMLDAFAKSPTDSHPNALFSAYASVLLCQRVADVIESDGRNTDLKGNKITDEKDEPIK